MTTADEIQKSNRYLPGKNYKDKQDCQDTLYFDDYLTVLCHKESFILYDYLVLV